MRPGGRCLAALAILAVASCAQLSPKPQPAPPIPINEDPYASTYAPYPGVPTLIRNATIFDGEGGRIDNGSVLFVDGKIVATHPPRADFAVPAGTMVIDGTGKFVTPGVIDIH